MVALSHRRCCVVALTRADSVCMGAGALLCNFKAILVQISFFKHKHDILTFYYPYMLQKE